MPKKPEAYSDSEAARRRDEVVRRMANTPPQPKVNPDRHQEKKKKAGADRAVHKGRADRER